MCDGLWPTLTGEPPTTIGRNAIHSCHRWLTADAEPKRTILSVF